MDTIINIDDIKIVRGHKTVIKAEVTDEEGNKLNGKAAIKVNNKNIVDTNAVDGVVTHDYDFSHLNNEKYIIEVVYSGDSEHKPARKSVELKIVNPDPEQSFSLNDVQNASFRLIKWININKVLPRNIVMKNDNVHIEDLLYLLVKNVSEIECGNLRWSLLKKFESPKYSSESIKEEGNLKQDEYIDVASNIQNFMEVNGRGPSFAQTSLGKIGYMNMIYTYATIVANSSSEGLITSVNIRPWKEIVAK